MKIVNKSVECIATFSPKGEIRPNRIRLVNDQEEYEVINVDKVQRSENRKIDGVSCVIFTCISAINGVEKIYELRFIVKDAQWVLWKI